MHPCVFRLFTLFILKFWLCLLANKLVYLLATRKTNGNLGLEITDYSSLCPDILSAVQHV